MKNYLFVLGLCFIAACQPRVDPRGNTTVEENFESFVAGKTTTNDVLEKCGTPSLHKDNYTWIYVGGKVEEGPFGSPKAIQKFIVKMIFDQNKILRSIEKIDPKENGDFMDEKNTNLMSEHTAKTKVDEVLKRRKE
ncbi:MAG: hypothetical protein LBL99_03495 [Holosporaceae bacterium]|jgi:outer membrane protein assembly factor BamE (lipoprotein component of BamABCDE complex)|nr:hypothetical protein [Holosporaceae bacterium]